MITHMKGQNLENLKEWLMAFHNGQTVVPPIPSQLRIGRRPRTSVENVLRHRFDIARILRKRRREHHGQKPSALEDWRHSGEFLLETWLETAKTPIKLW